MYTWQSVINTCLHVLIPTYTNSINKACFKSFLTLDWYLLVFLQTPTGGSSFLSAFLSNLNYNY